MRARARAQSFVKRSIRECVLPCVYERQLLLVTFLIFFKNLSILFKTSTRHMTKEKTRKARVKITKLNQSDRIVCKASSSKTGGRREKNYFDRNACTRRQGDSRQKERKAGDGGGGQINRFEECRPSDDRVTRCERGTCSPSLVVTHAS